MCVSFRDPLPILSDSLSTENQMKRTVPLNKIMYFYGFEHCWTPLGKSTSQQKVYRYNKGQVGFWDADLQPQFQPQKLGCCVNIKINKNIKSNLIN